MIATQTNSKDTKTADLLARLQALEEENQRLKAARNAKLSMKVSEKGCLSIYGLSKFPLSLYASQWRKVIELVPQIQAFLEANKDKLTEKQA